MRRFYDKDNQNIRSRLIPYRQCSATRRQYGNTAPLLRKYMQITDKMVKNA